MKKLFLLPLYAVLLIFATNLFAAPATYRGVFFGTGEQTNLVLRTKVSGTGDHATTLTNFAYADLPYLAGGTNLYVESLGSGLFRTNRFNVTGLASPADVAAQISTNTGGGISSFPPNTTNSIPKVGAYSAFSVSAKENNGNIALLWVATSAHTNYDGAIMFSISTNNGVSYSTPVTIMTNATAQPHFAFGIDSSNRWQLVWGWDSNVVEIQQLYSRYSDDHGATWSSDTAVPRTKPTDFNCAITNFIYGKIVQLANGKLVAGVYDLGIGATNSQTWELFSSDHGATWTTNYISGWTTDGGNEVSFVSLGGSNALCMVRLEEGGTSSNKRLYQFSSSDNGVTWRAVGFVSLGLAASTLRNPPELYSYDGIDGRHVVLAWGNRTSAQLEIRDVLASDVFNNTTIWDTAKVETFPGGTLGTSSGGGYPSIVGKNGNLIVSFYADASAIDGSLKFVQRSGQSSGGYALPNYTSTFQNINATTSGQYGDATSLTLPFGNWYVYPSVTFVRSGATFTSTDFDVGVGFTSGNSFPEELPGVNASDNNGIAPTTFLSFVGICPMVPISVTTATTNVYLKTYVATYTIGTPTMYGKLMAIPAR